MYFHTVESWNTQIDLGPLDPTSRQGTAHVFQALIKHQEKNMSVEEFALMKICIGLFLDAHTTLMDIEEEHPNTCNACHCILLGNKTRSPAIRIAFAT